MTAGFLGSQGEAFGDRLSQQRPNMDAAVEAFFQQRDQIDALNVGEARARTLEEAREDRGGKGAVVPRCACATDYRGGRGPKDRDGPRSCSGKHAAREGSEE